MASLRNGYPEASLSFRQALFELSQEFRQWDTQRGTNLTKLQHIESALPRFVLAHERLRLTDSRSKVLLAQVRSLPHLAQQLLKSDLLSPKTLFSIVLPTHRVFQGACVLNRG